MRPVSKFTSLIILATLSFPAFAFAGDARQPVAARVETNPQAAVPETEKDLTLRAMHDEMERARTRLQLPGVDKPFYVEYRLLDLDVRSVTSSFGALISTSVTRSGTVAFSSDHKSLSTSRIGPVTSISKDIT